MIFAYRPQPPAQTQMKPNAAAKVTFVETPADGPNKENDQPASDGGRVSEEDGQETAAGGDKARGADGAGDDDDADDGGAKIIPWRAKLRKTNSTLNLLEWYRYGASSPPPGGRFRAHARQYAFSNDTCRIIIIIIIIALLLLFI